MADLDLPIAEIPDEGLAALHAVTKEARAETPLESAPLPTAREEAQPATGSSGILAIPIDLELVLATVRMPVSRLMDLVPGSEIDLDSLSSGEVSLNANGTLFAVGELFLLDAAAKRVGLRIKRLAGAAL
jgi:flagellar motor switch/type III secretory pathway protein FliN